MFRVPSRVIFYFVVSLAFAAALQAQQSSTSSSSTASSASTPAGDSAAPSDNRIVMKVGDTKLTESYFNDVFADFWKANEGGPVQQRKKIGEAYASALSLSKLATSQGLEKDPEVQRQIEASRVQILANAAYERMEKQAKPTMQQISAYYDSHLDDFDQVAIRRLFVYKVTPDSQGHGLPDAQAKARADEIRKILASGGDAKALIASTKDMLDAEPLTFKRGELPGNMAKAFDMKEGEWSQVVDTPDADMFFQVVKKDRLTLAQATPNIEKKLQNDKLREDLEALKDKTGIWMDEAYFSGPVTASKAAVPNPSSQQQAQEKR